MKENIWLTRLLDIKWLSQYVFKMLAVAVRKIYMNYVYDDYAFIFSLQNYSFQIKILQKA